MPTLYVIAGCNGAGKTTLSKNLLPGHLGVIEFVNADEIARGLSPFNPEGVAFSAGRIMLQRIDELIAEQKNFAIETTLSTRSYAPLFKELQKNGYQIFLLFVYMQNVNEAKRRVNQRVKEGGHNIPENVIERRFIRGLKNLTAIYLPLATDWLVIDNSSESVIFVAEKKAGKIMINNFTLWDEINSYE
jgi:predicted ABC-type ATPase